MESDSGKNIDSLSIALLGSGGSGVMTAGSLLLEAAGKAGCYGLMTRSSGPQIRGGEAAALLRLAPKPVESHKDRFDILLAIDWKNADRFVGEIKLDADSLVIGDSNSKIVIPEAISNMGGRYTELPLAALAKEIEGGRPNMVALGVLSELIGLPTDALVTVLEKSLARKGQDAVVAGCKGVESGNEQALNLPRIPAFEVPQKLSDKRWNITGNEAAGLGAVRGGIRFVAAYPITPATEILEWLAPSLEKIGGVLVQAEDELASVNQLLGASFGGTPSLTATSGPGLALMTESIGLAVASETPIVVVNVMRGGPSTGIPTKSEQSDLNIAIYGLHGDAPHLVLAPTSIADCLLTTQWSVHLAEMLQTAAIVLSDQSLGQSRVVVDRPGDISFMGQRNKHEQPDENYQRYAVNDMGVSPMAIPGLAMCQYTADGLEHTQTGIPSSRAEDHLLQMDKRQRKLDQYDYGDYWAEIEGKSEIAVITWGSCCSPVREAIGMLGREGVAIKLIALRLLLPAQPQRLADELSGVKRVLVVEQSHSAQFNLYLRAQYELEVEVNSMAIPGPLPVSPLEVYKKLKTLEKDQ